MMKTESDATPSSPAETTTVAGAAAELRKLEDTIGTLLMAYEKITGMRVERLDMTRVVTLDPFRPGRLMVQIDAALPGGGW